MLLCSTDRLEDEQRRRSAGPKEEATSQGARQAELPAEPVEHHEELHRQGPVKDSHAGQLLRAPQHAPETDGGL